VVERAAHNRLVVGSNPTGPTFGNTPHIATPIIKEARSSVVEQDGSHRSRMGAKHPEVGVRCPEAGITAWL
jgi:hypothetical protein